MDRNYYVIAMVEQCLSGRFAPFQVCCIDGSDTYSQATMHQMVDAWRTIRCKEFRLAGLDFHDNASEFLVEVYAPSLERALEMATEKFADEHKN